MIKITRRNLLKLGALGASHGLLPPLPPLPFVDGKEAPIIARRPIISFARAISWGIRVYNEPNFSAKVVDQMSQDETRPVYAELTTASGSSYNKRWFEVDGGYVYSSLIHIVPWEYNPSITDAGAKGFWAEVTVPFTDSRVAPSLSAARTKYRYYGGTTYKVIRVVPGKGASPADPAAAFDYDWWYQVEDESFPGSYFVPARHLRQVPQSEFTTLSPDVDPRDKRIEIRLSDKRVIAYEKGKEVFATRCASGARFSADKDFRTPPGQYRIFRKTPSQHMYGGAFGDNDYYDLPGIPWVSYFTYSGIAFHGAYWHNDYGSERSHGCINLLDKDARWIYRWTTPRSEIYDRYTMTSTFTEGTAVTVIGVNG
ncbi:MAG TPA: L,D-transpeptidase [Thermoflexales bacterium]|jgi:lipoprotein-anchoring transpeptidase ErfK/SrfK|nr:L,D-transpeptidase [Anaerolineae bacterium]HQV28271.1 L,D-transpeptidase [Thermoflexales bacterium]HQX12282.1 L,D-transpeptidase [Thermoflexales bacterium]HQY25608.1 L,D-transpeptidase [Thermoflexales bacterium]HQZ54139.1 L,D-transpeptidase [Thermoflexales bacterium]